MPQKYKIGVISKIFGIPVQTLRYYEKCGFITPEKDDNSNYRYYDAWDINFLLDGKYLRAFEFSGTEVEMLINNANLSEYQKQFELQQKILLEKVCYYQDLLEATIAEREKLNNLSNAVGCYTHCKNEAMFFQSYRNGNTFQISDDTSKFPQVSPWLEHFPFIRATYVIDYTTIDITTPEAMQYRWGFSASPAKAKEFHLDSASHTEFIPSRKCIYTVFYATDKNTFSRSILEQVVIPISDKGYRIIANPVGNLIVRTHEQEQISRYFEIWIPVENN